ncbi:hypothetical protein NUH88_08855 [Nisaea acidiphila]|uniref:Uncharacterized protein n=1 Tax=Nisaea acidiphila TaxID=1862145 RepID=A0A9J7AZX8_9PROT|nr:hypothetical protein [Nisaea acidiphila]UUX51796.1 hypothetical protein NUH88_08855 [Nisaea acidiphila]
MNVIACLDAPVGPGTGQPHDVALVQAMLARITDRTGGSYWKGQLDGRACDALAETISRFQEEFDLLDESGEEVRAMIDPASVTYQCLRDAAPPLLAGLRAIAGTATLYVPPAGGSRVLSVLTAKLRCIGYAGSPAFGRSLAVLAERVFDRHRFLIRFPMSANDKPEHRVRVALHGLKWLTEGGALTSSESGTNPVPRAIWSLVASEAERLRTLVPELREQEGHAQLWLRHDG